ncbi:MAG: nucleoside triphosphate pyrophosphohydrolase [Verrucomicrobia bacterium]|jgi:MazG family protein|nr:nucleoside triphosphate pyrophosphohydrolase [Verrucomicrobiota bacterium]
MKKKPAIEDLLRVMAKLRSPKGCPWDREQNHMTLRHHAIEEVYELIDAIEAGDDHEMAEELGDLLLQVVFHCQMAKERGAFDFEKVCRVLVEKLIRRHPHVFGNLKVKDVDEVWANWEKIKHAEKKGTRRERPSALDGIPKHLPALLRAEKLVKKARKAGLLGPAGTRFTASPISKKKSLGRSGTRPYQPQKSKSAIAGQLFALAQQAQAHGWSAEELLVAEIKRREKSLRQCESNQPDALNEYENV